MTIEFLTGNKINDFISNLRTLSPEDLYDFYVLYANSDEGQKVLKNFYPISFATTKVEEIFLLPRHQLLNLDDHRHLMFVSRGISIDFIDLLYKPNYITENAA